MSNAVTVVPAAPAADALAHFSHRLTFETDCWDVHDALSRGERDFVVLDVRSRQLYERGHVPGALCLPHGKITPRRLEDWDLSTLFVVYCAGPHCNGANRAAIRLARLGRSVKEMIGGLTGWQDEGFRLQVGPAVGSLSEDGASVDI